MRVAARAAEVYRELREVVSEARRSGLEGTESYRRLVSALDELAAALHRMLYVDAKLDLETERVVAEALEPPCGAQGALRGDCPPMTEATERFILLRGA
ncbi:MAG: hypothetical protein DRJ56_03820 [Thermoprotei archaeon]|nr:MAG: hypothetical protein DRJ56_03820 [Thermoprotei archaeon]